MRSKWKGVYCSETLRKNINNSCPAPSGVSEKHGAETVIKTDSRRSTILPEFVGKTVMIHNGKNYTTLKINKEHIGYKFGEFSITKKIPVYKRK